MSVFLGRKLLREYCWKALLRNSREYDPSDFARPAVVFSPHFDDETLGCGGLILKKRRAGADLQIAFLTDGSKSHAESISENALRAMRMEEGLSAAASLGVDSENVFCLGYEETRLANHQDQAIYEVLQILQTHQPEEIYLPYSREPGLWSSDHRVTASIVLKAIQAWQNVVTLYEYPIWFWFHWPWVGLPVRQRHNRKAILNNSLKNLFGLHAITELRCSVFIGNVLEHKRKALNQHKSQVCRLVTDEDWPILQDVADGEFLECFFQPVEMFRRSVFPWKPSRYP